MNDDHTQKREEDATSSGDVLARMLRQAGNRPAVPAEDTAIVKAAALDEWQRLVVSEKRRKFAWRFGSYLAAAAVLLAAVNFGFFHRPDAPPSTIAVLEVLQGEVSMHAGDVSRAAVLGDEFVVGSGVSTEMDDRAVLRLADGATIRLDHGTRLRFVSASAVELDRGAVYIDSGSEDASGALEVRTALGIARDIGTRFEVRLGEASEPGEASELTVRVRQGKVALERSGESYVAEASQQLRVGPDGSVVRDRISPHGSEWDWTLDILPDFTVEGRLLKDLLVWAADEGGLELRFEDRELEDATSEIILHGSIQGVGLDDALALAFLSSDLRLTHSVDGGELLIRRKAE